jgi:hypothetical protein
MDELGDINLRPDLVARLQSCDLGVDVIGTSFTRERDAMVSVLDEVGPTDLEDGDRRQNSVRERRPQTGQAASRYAALGSEVAAEVVAAIDGADYVVDRGSPAGRDRSAARVRAGGSPRRRG